MLKSWKLVFIRENVSAFHAPAFFGDCDVAVPWDIAYFIEFLKPRLGERNAEFLTAIAAALNDRTKLSALSQFPGMAQPAARFALRAVAVKPNAESDRPSRFSDRNSR